MSIKVPQTSRGDNRPSYGEQVSDHHEHEQFEDLDDQEAEEQEDRGDDEDHYEDFLLDQAEYAESVRAPLWEVIDSALMRGLPDVRRLSHYTNLDALRGIAQDGAVFASETSFMNDPSEWKYALGIVEEAWASLAGACPGEFVEDGRAAIDQITMEKTRPRAFIACFTAQDDLLSQWRGYGTGNSCSISVEFPMSEFNEIGRRDPYRRLNRDAGAPRPTSRLLRPVIYDPVDQTRVVTEVIQAWIAAVATAHSPGGYFPTTGRDGAAIRRDALIESLLPAIPYLKSPAYCAEEEWRLCVIADIWQQQRYLKERKHIAPHHLTVEYRSSPLGPVPFMRWPITTSQSPRQAPIREVVLGPDCRVSQADVELMLMVHNYFDVRVRRSAVPYRGG